MLIGSGIDYSALVTPTADIPGIHRLAPAEPLEQSYARLNPTTWRSSAPLVYASFAPTAHDRALAKLLAFRDLEPDWDAEGAPAAEPAAIEMAVDVLSLATAAGIQMVPSLGGAGTIFLHPRGCGLSGEITIGAEGDLLVIADLEGDRVDFEADPGEQIPLGVRDLFLRAGASVSH